MKANELRIGNIVHYSVDGKFIPINIRSITDDERVNVNYYDGEGDWIYSELISGIPLTPEILVKMGFEKCNNMDEWYRLRLLNEWSFLEYNVKYYMFNMNINNHNCLLGKRVSGDVHQLQNLYFALTGTELEFTK